MTQKKRVYEVSIWTLQDEFIDILKASNIERKGQISEPKMILKDDGTEEFSFSIPMYLYIGKDRIENPIWYKTQDGTIIEDLRKIKVTFNKNTPDEETFEFLIIDVTEKHENDQLICEVKCEGLAFHELGKVGYKISLHTEDFEETDYEWFKNGANESIKPVANLQYWIKDFLEPIPEDGKIDPSKWYYIIDMNWNSFSDAGNRDTDKIYEEEYSGSWDYNSEKDILIPNTIVSYKEKERMIDLEESNIYNLTQDIAKKFGVFCRYKYDHDASLHITKRLVIFYNNFVEEEHGYLDLTYPYDTSSISRNRDSKDVTTKMFIRAVEEDTAPSGLVTIMDSDANKSGEDYILDFDYLYKNGNVTAEQYAEIPNYITSMYKYNKTLREYASILQCLYDKVPELEATVTIQTNAIQLDKERITESDELLNNLTDGTQIIQIAASNPVTAILLPNNDNTFYIKITEQGVYAETVKIYRNFNFSSKVLTDEITTGVPVYDEFDNLIKINYLTKEEGPDPSSKVYLTYSYRPQLAQEKVKKSWTYRLAQDEDKLAEAQQKLDDTNAKIEEIEEKYDEALAEKTKCIADFNKMMGPALRESYWQPEEYKDHGDNYYDSFNLKLTAAAIPGSTKYAEFIWDDVLFDDEQDAKYLFGSGATSYEYYPAIDLSEHLEYVGENIDKISFMFYDYIGTELHPHAPKDIKSFSAGSTALYAFIKVGNTIKPALLITNVETLTEESRSRMTDPSFSPKVGIVTTTIGEDGPETTIDSNSFNATFINAIGTTGEFSEITIVYPRVRIKNLNLNTSNDMLQLSYRKSSTETINFSSPVDFYALSRDDSTWEGTTLQTAASAYYVTLKPQSLIAQKVLTNKQLCINYNISNASTAIYLDALQVMKENSQPKVSYTVEPSAINDEFLYTLYKKLRYICNINDNDLKFENVQGYISELTLDCDHEENDEIEIKNYKTKVEDLFSTIVAQTQAMTKSEYTLGLASAAFNTIGELNKDVLQNTLRRYDFDYAFNNGTLTIDEEEGIWATSDSGVVAIRGGGIFTATEKDDQGNWRWNTGIIPQGINADLITTGQLDTNLVRIFAGDKLRLQMNGDGLFAYKSIFEDEEVMNAVSQSSAAIQQELDDTKGLDTAQYVVHNENGLFLVAEPGAYVVDKTTGTLTQIEEQIKRVEISWNGFVLRDWEGNKTFYADPDTGDLTLTGAVYSKGLYIGNNSIDDGDIVLESDSTIDLRSKDISIIGSGSVSIAAGETLTLTSLGEFSILNPVKTYLFWPQWVSEEQYFAGDRVKYTSNGITKGYICIQDNNDAIFDTNKWEEYPVEPTINAITMDETGLSIVSTSDLQMDGGNILLAGGSISLMSKLGNGGIRIGHIVNEGQQTEEEIEDLVLTGDGTVECNSLVAGELTVRNQKFLNLIPGSITYNAAIMQNNSSITGYIPEGLTEGIWIIPETANNNSSNELPKLMTLDSWGQELATTITWNVSDSGNPYGGDTICDVNIKFTLQTTSLQHEIGDVQTVDFYLYGYKDTEQQGQIIQDWKNIGHFAPNATIYAGGKSRDFEFTCPSVEILTAQSTSAQFKLEFTKKKNDVRIYYNKAKPVQITYIPKSGGTVSRVRSCQIVYVAPEGT